MYHFPGKTDTVTYSEKYLSKVIKLSCLNIILSAPMKKKLKMPEWEGRDRQTRYKEEIIRLASHSSRTTVHARTQWNNVL